MIRIMKPGKTIRYEFVCKDCGCEYIADLEDVLPPTPTPGAKVCNCPNCKSRNIGMQIEYEED